MSCPNCQIAGRRLPALPLGYISKMKKEVCYKNFRNFNISSRNIRVQHIGSATLPRIKRTTYLEEYEAIEKQLLNDPNIVEDYVMKHVSQDQIERWLIRKAQLKNRANSGGGKNRRSLSKWKFCVHKDKRKMLEKLTANIHEKKQKNYILNELVINIAQAVHATRYNLYFVDEMGAFLVSFTEGADSDLMPKQEIASSNTISSYVARHNELVYVTEIIGDDRFPGGTGKDGTDLSVICYPLCNSNKSLIGVIEFVKDASTCPFAEEDVEIVCSYMTWGSIALYYAEVANQVVSHSKIEAFVFDFSRALLHGTENTTDAVKSLMEFAKKNSGCAHYMLFTYQSEENELNLAVSNLAVGDCKKIVLSFSADKGIAGEVFKSQKLTNVKDAYSEKNFLRETDQKMGITTKTILSAPVVAGGRSMGVVQLINKERDIFSVQDEKMLMLCAIYCSSILSNGKARSELVKRKAEVKMLGEILDYHVKPCRKELRQLNQVSQVVVMPSDFYSFNFNFHGNDEYLSPWFVSMAKQLFQQCDFKYCDRALIHFTLKCKHHYRDLPYHNWEHAFSVTQFLYLILQKVFSKFEKLEVIALFIAAVCHDLDHRAQNNAFVQITKSPLALLYEGSCLENHHYYMAMNILQSKECNIFASLGGAEREKVFILMKEAILATDLLRHFTYRDKLRDVIEKKMFDWNNKNLRYLAAYVMMTLSDLCASCKPWETHKISVAKVFEEFFAQGDKEISLGITPIPMFTQRDEVPLNEVGFLNAIVMPCVGVLKEIIPELTDVQQAVQINLSKWEGIVKKQLEEVQQNGPPGKSTEKKLDQLKISGSKLQERSLSFVRYNCSGILEMGKT